MAKQKLRPTRLSGFSGVKAYMLYVEVLKNHCNAVGRTFCDAITIFTHAINILPAPSRHNKPTKKNIFIIIRQLADKCQDIGYPSLTVKSVTT
jgi:hypothetical protein